MRLRDLQAQMVRKNSNKMLVERVARESKKKHLHMPQQTWADVRHDKAKGVKSWMGDSQSRLVHSSPKRPLEAYESGKVDPYWVRSGRSKGAAKRREADRNAPRRS